MKAETREFKHVQFLLLLPETPGEVGLLDRITDEKAVENMKLDAVITTDDLFRPYIRILIPDRRGNVKGKEKLPAAKPL